MSEIPIDPKPQWSFKVPKPSRRTVATTSVVAVVVALLPIISGFMSKRNSNRERTVTWIGGEQQTDWKPTTHDFRNTAYHIGITDDGFVVARPMKLPLAPPPQVMPPTNVPALTNK